MAKQVIFDGLSGPYRLRVTRQRPYWGLLEVVHEGITIAAERVGITSDARFGPDTADVEDWHAIARHRIHSYETKQKER